MKTVFSNEMCAHVWAQQSQPSGHSASMSFSGRWLRSYSTAIGYIPDGAEYGLCALLTSNSYSMTTSSKHMPAARTAVRGRDVWYVPVMDVGPRNNQGNADYLLGAYQKHVASMLRLQSWYHTDLVGVHGVHGAITGAWDSYAGFCVCFKVPLAADTRDADAAKIWARMERLNVERADPKYIEKREKARASRTEAQKRKEEREELARIERARVDALEAIERVKEWRNGNRSVHLHYRDVPESDGALLRYIPAHDVNPARIETSMGANVPADDAHRVYKLYKRICRPGQPRWTAPEDFAAEVAMGQFKLDAIRDDGSIRAGCHTIKAEEIERLAVAAGW
jgi:hypothetical protein